MFGVGGGVGWVNQSSSVEYGKSDASNSIVKTIKSEHDQEVCITTTNTPFANTHSNSDTNNTLTLAMTTQSTPDMHT